MFSALYDCNDVLFLEAEQRSTAGSTARWQHCARLITGHAVVNIWSVQLAEHRSSSNVLQVSQTRTGFDDDGNIIFTLEHSLQNISPQFRQ